MDIERYAAFHGATPVGRRRYMSIFTSRACPYQCTYCHTIFGKEFRCRSAANVVAEIRELKARYGIRIIEVCDDIFNMKWQRSTEVCQAIASAGLDIAMSFPNGLRADIMRDELLAGDVRRGNLLHFLRRRDRLAAAAAVHQEAPAISSAPAR